MTVGPPTVGKTTLKEQLLANKEANTNTVEEEHDRPPSTPVSEKVKRIEIILDKKKSKQSPLTVAVDKYSWKTLTLNQELIRCLKKTIESYKAVNIIKQSIWIYLFMFIGVFLYIVSTIKPLLCIDNGANSVSKNIDYITINWVITAIICSGVPFLIFLIYIKGMIKFNWIHLFFMKDSNKRPITADILIKEALKSNDVKNVQPMFDQALTIYFRDCGGQPEFHEVLPALVSHSTLFFLVFNLSEDLDSQYNVTYKTAENKVSVPYESSFTVGQALLQCLASISSIGNYLKPRSSVLHRLKSLFMQLLEIVLHFWKKKIGLGVSKVIIIGTHKDKLGDIEKADNDVLRIDNQLQSQLKGTDWYTKDMVIPTETGRILLGITTFNPNDVRRLKDLVNDIALSGNYQINVPVPWLAFEFCIRKLGKKVMTLKECQHLAQECKIKRKEEFNAALWFLHNVVGTIRYFKNVPELENVVITDTELLFDIVTDLVVNTFTFGKHITKKSEYDRFRSSGRFTRKHLMHCQAIKKKLLSIEQVLAVLEHLVIIAPLGINEGSKEKEYFLPCVLVHASLPTTPLIHDNGDIFSLLITFKCLYTPRGIFSSLVAQILLDGKDKWKLCSDEIYRNQVEFLLVQSGHIIKITNFFRFLEIAVKPPSGTYNTRTSGNVYFFVQCYISQCLKYVRHQLNYTDTADHFCGFYCKEHDELSVEKHSAKCNNNDNPTYTICSLNGRLTAKILPKQELWFHKKCESLYIAVIKL